MTSEHLVVKAVIITAIVSFFVVALGASTQIGTNMSGESNLQTLFETFKQNNQEVFVTFVEPQTGESYVWTIPEEVGSGLDGFISRRVWGDIGTDYFCTQTLNEGFTSVDCVPYTNIYTINYLE